MSKPQYLHRQGSLEIWLLGWAGLLIVIFLGFGGSPYSERSTWYRFLTAYVLQNVPFLVASLLCLRNGLTKGVASSRGVWLLIGFALIAYLLGNIFFSSWELLWGLNSTGSLGDPFYFVFYLFLSLAMVIAVFNHRNRFKKAHWLIALSLSVYASLTLLWIYKPPATKVLTIPVSSGTNQEYSEKSTATDISTATAPKLPETKKVPPEWVVFFDDLLKPYGQTANLFYVIFDVILLSLSALMLFAFWGKSFSNPWQVNAQAIICFYIADMWYAYAVNQIEGYQAGFSLEAFWLLGAVQFAISAEIEYNLMLTMRR